MCLKTSTNISQYTQSNSREVASLAYWGPKTKIKKSYHEVSWDRPRKALHFKLRKLQNSTISVQYGGGKSCEGEREREVEREFSPLIRSMGQSFSFEFRGLLAGERKQEQAVGVRPSVRPQSRR